MGDFSQPCLAILAGSGELPLRVIEQCRFQQRHYVVVTFHGQDYCQALMDVSDAQFSLGEVGGTIDFLKQHDVGEIILLGNISRPDLRSLRTDKLGVKVLARLAKGGLLGDDGILRRIIDELESLSGAKVIGYEDIVGAIEHGLGVMGSCVVGSEDEDNIRRAEEVFAAFESCDVGQSVVVQGGVVIAVEAIEGTDELLRRSGGLLREGGRGLLFKKMKSSQTSLVDLPTVGVQTLDGIRDAGLHGLVIGRRGVIMVDAEQMINRADAEGLFIFVVE